MSAEQCSHLCIFFKHISWLNGRRRQEPTLDELIIHHEWHNRILNVCQSLRLCCYRVQWNRTCGDVRNKDGTREWKDFKIQTSGCFFHSAICLLHLMFQSPSFLLSRLHSPPPQSNWFRSTSWGGYGVGMWAFCFHLSVNSDAVPKKNKK